MMQSASHLLTQDVRTSSVCYILCVTAPALLLCWEGVGAVLGA